MNKFISICFIFFAFITISCDEQSDYYCTINNSQQYFQPDSELNNSNYSNKYINKSGSRIIFNEYHLSDGSIIYDDTPFDSYYNRYCSFVNGSSEIYSGLEGCCVSFFNSLIDVITAYNNSNCTDEISLVMVNGDSYNFDKEISLVTTYNYSTYTCSLNATNRYIQIESHINHFVYLKTSDGKCITWEEYASNFYNYKECYYLASYKELTVDEVRSFFVCAD